MDISKLKTITIIGKPLPRDYFLEEERHFEEIGIKENGVLLPELSIARLYFDDPKILSDTMIDLKLIGARVVIKYGLTRIVVFKNEHASLLCYYLEGRKIDCQGTHTSKR